MIAAGRYGKISAADIAAAATRAGANLTEAYFRLSFNCGGHFCRRGERYIRVLKFEILLLIRAYANGIVIGGCRRSRAPLRVACNEMKMRYLLVPP